MTIRAVTPADYPWMLRLSARHEEETSELGAEKLARLHEISFRAAIAGAEQGFVLAFAEQTAYESLNYQWFGAQFERFVYIDRVIVDEDARGTGLGRALYRDVIAAARAAGHEHLVCEVNFDPPNPISDAFHDRLGFLEVARVRLANGKGVRYLQLRLS